MKKTKNIKKSLAKAIFILYLLLVWLFFIDRGLIIHKLFGAYWQFIRPLGFRSINLSPSFSTMLSEGKDVFVLNLAAFIPMGFFICLFTKGKSKYKHVYLIFAIPVLIELLQYIFATGALDINDIILNVISGVIGVTTYAIIHKINKIAKSLAYARLFLYADRLRESEINFVFCEWVLYVGTAPSKRRKAPKIARTRCPCKFFQSIRVQQVAPTSLYTREAKRVIYFY